MWWSWVLASIGLFGLLMAGRSYWWAWLINLGVQILWIVYAITTEQYGFIMSAVAYGLVYGYNALRWKRQQDERTRQ